MADSYSVIYDPVAKEPFGIIRQSSFGTTAYAVQKSAHAWATDYNSGSKRIPHGMSASDFVEMGCDFVESFKNAFARSDRVARRAEMLSSKQTEYRPTEVIYGKGPARIAKRKAQITRKVMPVIIHAQREAMRAKFINQAIRRGRGWLKRDKA